MQEEERPFLTMQNGCYERANLGRVGGSGGRTEALQTSEPNVIVSSTLSESNGMCTLVLHFFLVGYVVIRTNDR